VNNTHNSHDDGPLLLTIADVCGQLSVRRKTIESLIRDKELKVTRIGRRTLIPRTSLLSYIRKHTE
jgi:excisionase family DNA binding protein